MVDDGGRVGAGELGEERAERRPGQPRRQGEPAQEEHREADDAERALGEAELTDRRLEAPEDPAHLCCHQACILMISVKASTALLRIAAVSSSATLAWVDAMV